MERFCVRFGFVCDLMKTRKIARRLGESTKIEDLRERKCYNFQNKNASEICPTTVAKNDPKMEPIWMPNGAKMEPKRHPKSNVFFDGFPEASGNIGGTATAPRAEPYYQRIVYKNKQKQYSLADLARLGPLARRIFFLLCIPHMGNESVGTVHSRYLFAIWSAQLRFECV